MNASMKASHMGQLCCSHGMTIASFILDHAARPRCAANRRVDILLVDPTLPSRCRRNGQCRPAYGSGKADRAFSGNQRSGLPGIAAEEAIVGNVEPLSDASTHLAQRWATDMELENFLLRF